MLVMVLVLVAGNGVASTVAQDGKLADCPNSPNCASSVATNPARQIAPLILLGDQDQAWVSIRKAVTQLPRCRVVAEDATYLHAECHSALFGFVDDLELQLFADQGVVALRSAARSGYYDFGVNRRRLEKLRNELIAAGVVGSVD